MALAELGLIDEYEFVVQPWLVDHGPTLFAGLSKRVDLRAAEPQAVMRALSMVLSERTGWREDQI